MCPLSGTAHFPAGPRPLMVNKVMATAAELLEMGVSLWERLISAEDPLTPDHWVVKKLFQLKYAAKVRDVVMNLTCR